MKISKKKVISKINAPNVRNITYHFVEYFIHLLYQQFKFEKISNRNYCLYLSFCGLTISFQPIYYILWYHTIKEDFWFQICLNNKVFHVCILEVTVLMFSTNFVHLLKHVLVNSDSVEDSPIIQHIVAL